MAAPGRTHEQEIEAADQAHRHRVAERQQWARLVLILTLTAVWLAQTLYVTVWAVKEPAILDAVESFIALIGVTGVVVGGIIVKLWPENHGST